MSNIYTSGEYLETTGDTWHSEDSPWKASQVLRIIAKNNLHPKRIAEIGCGAGRILEDLSKQSYLADARFEGYDISPQAMELCNRIDSTNCQFSCSDLLSDENTQRFFDVLLVIDVFEHVPDYMGFVRKCRVKADYKIYHIPLDLSVSSVLRNSFISAGGVFPGGRSHLHYFTADWAIATLKETGHEIIDYFYTAGSLGVFWQHPSLKLAIANCPRWLFSKLSVSLTARYFGGYSLLVLAK
jgi:cyclopropane fatty-acyl-phospholipid synthase-like methyltransferase